MFGFIAATPLPLSHATHTQRAACTRTRRYGLPMMSAKLTRRSLGHAVFAAAAASVLPKGALAQLLSSELAPPVTTAEKAAALRKLVAAAIKKDPTMAATLLRLAFHDAFPIDLKTGKGGANGSIHYETGRGENFGLDRAVDLLTPMQATTGLGWGDTVAVAGATAVEETGGPKIDVRLGRDSATEEDTQNTLPSPAENVEELRKRFVPRGFDDRDLVALSGGHTLGRVGGGGPFVAEPNRFKNDYFKNLMWIQGRRERGLSTKVGPPDKPNFQLPSDLALLDDAETLKIVKEFANNQNAFFQAFVKSYNKMMAIGTPFAAYP